MKNIMQIQWKLKEKWKKCYIVWGYCRDTLLWLTPPEDIDLVTDALPSEIENILHVVSDLWQKFGTLIVREGNQVFEITTFRKDIGSINHRKPAEVGFTWSLEEDAERRDFTMNAIYFDPENQTFIDPTGGINDIKNHTIRFIGNINERIHEDSLRILRFIRFKNKYWLNVADTHYFNVLSEKTVLLKKISIERIKEEFNKILLLEENINALTELKQIWFFKIFLPEIESLESCPWNKYHKEGNVWIHTLMAINELNRIQKETRKDDTYFLDLYWAVLLHDIGKPPCITKDENWDIHYYEHQKVGTKIFKEKISKEFKFSKHSKNKIAWLIENHLKTFYIPEMRKIKARKLMMHHYFDELLVIWEADCLWIRPRDASQLIEVKKIYHDFKKMLAKKKFLTGDDIIKRFPHLQWVEIWKKLREENDKILCQD